MLLAHTRKFPAALMRKFVMTWSPLSGNIFTSFLLYPHPNGNKVNGYQKTNAYEETIEREQLVTKKLLVAEGAIQFLS